MNRFTHLLPCLLFRPIDCWEAAVSPITLARRQLRALPKPTTPPPKKPLTAFIFFGQEYRSSEPGLAKGNVTKAAGIIGQRWKELTDGEKKKYENKAASAKTAYERAYQQYLKSRTPKDVLLQQKISHLQKIINPKKNAKVPADVNAPAPPPPNAYGFFLKDVYSGSADQQRALVGQLLDGPVSQRGKILGAAWNGMSTSEKEGYANKAAAARSAYTKKLAAYNASHKVNDIKKEVSTILKRVATPPKPKKKKVTAVKKATKGAPRRLVKKAATKKTTAVKKAASKKAASKKAVTKKIVKPAVKKAVKGATAKKTAGKKTTTTAKKTAKKVAPKKATTTKKVTAAKTKASASKKVAAKKTATGKTKATAAKKVAARKSVKA
ncbi:high mobility group box 3 [Rhizophlyctis rosea]|nr:high mobility group box 3 [Rhizophlyctis rosea]